MPKRIPLLLALASLVIIGAACSDTAALAEQVTALEAQVTALEAKVTAQKAEVTAQAEEVTRFQERAAALEAGSSFDAEIAIADLTTAVDARHARLANSVKGLDTRMEDANSSIADLTLEHVEHLLFQSFWLADDWLHEEMMAEDLGLDVYFHPGIARQRMSLLLAFDAHPGKRADDLSVIRCQQWILGVSSKNVDASDCGLVPAD